MKTALPLIVSFSSILLSLQGQIGPSAPLSPTAPVSAVAAPTPPAPATLTVQGTKVVSQNGPHQVAFAADAKTVGAVDLLTSSGLRLKSTVFGLIYSDWATGKSGLIAELKSSVGELLPPNQIIYRDAFAGEGVSADLLYTYTLSSLEQAVIIRKQLPAPEQYGLPATSRLGVMTEFFSPPAPRQFIRVIDLRGVNQRLGVQGEAAMQDATLVFGAMRIVAGKAFLLGQTEPSAPVAKDWQVLEGRTFLTESTPYALLKPQLALLPALAAGPAVPQAPGVVLDYLIVTSPLMNPNFGGANTEKVAQFWEAPVLTTAKEELQPAKLTLVSEPTTTVSFTTTPESRGYRVTNPLILPFIKPAAVSYCLISDGLQSDTKPFSDRNYVITSAPEYLKSFTRLQTKMTDKEVTDSRFCIALSADRPVEVFLALDERLFDTYGRNGPPAWLQGFRATGDRITTDDPLMQQMSSVFQIFVKEYPGGRIVLGPCCASPSVNSMYFAFFAEKRVTP